MFVYGLGSKMYFEEHDISISLYTPFQLTKLLGKFTLTTSIT